MNYMIFSGPSLDDGALLALKNKLYVPGWSLQGNLVKINSLEKQKKNKTQIVLAFDGDKPVGIVLFNQSTRGRVFIMLFVRRAYRRKGVATNMIELWRRNYTCKKFVAFLGSEGSEAFLKKIGNTTIYYFEPKAENTSTIAKV